VNREPAPGADHLPQGWKRPNRDRPSGVRSSTRYLTSGRSASGQLLPSAQRPLRSSGKPAQFPVSGHGSSTAKPTKPAEESLTRAAPRSPAPAAAPIARCHECCSCSARLARRHAPATGPRRCRRATAPVIAGQRGCEDLKCIQQVEQVLAQNYLFAGPRRLRRAKAGRPAAAQPAHSDHSTGHPSRPPFHQGRRAERWP
jgi:hypothetical protein